MLNIRQPAKRGFFGLEIPQNGLKFVPGQVGLEINWKSRSEGEWWQTPPLSTLPPNKNASASRTSDKFQGISAKEEQHHPSNYKSFRFIN